MKVNGILAICARRRLCLYTPLLYLTYYYTSGLLINVQTLHLYEDEMNTLYHFECDEKTEQWTKLA